MDWTTKDLELLESGEIEVLGRLTQASNASLYCRVFSDHQEVNAIYKPISGERPLWDFPDGNLALREVATYLTSEALSFNCVPPTLMREGPFGLGSIQLWIEDAELIEDAFSKENDELRKIALLDAIVNNTDRKLSHLLFKDGKNTMKKTIMIKMLLFKNQ